MHIHEYIKNHRIVHLGEKEKTRQFFVKNPPAMQEAPVQFLGRVDPLERDRLLTPVFLGFPGGSAERIYLQCRRPGFDPWVGKIPWRRKWLPTPVFWPGEFDGL